MKLSQHFDIDEFTESDTATRCGIDNDIPIELLPEAKKTAEMMEKIRGYLSDRLGQECIIDVTSAYRCLALNTEIKSDPTSDHVKMMAVDFKAPKFGSPYDIARELAPAMEFLGIGQLIHEFGRWVHVSTRTPDKLINRIITYKMTNGKKECLIGIQEA